MMTDYKLVPVEPTTEMLVAYCGAQPSNIAVYLSDGVEPYKAMLAAAPAVQGEPVAWQVINIKYPKVEPATHNRYPDWAEGDQGLKIIPLYAAPQFVEQQPDDSAAVRMDKQRRQDVAAALGFIRGGNYAWSYLLQQIKDVVSVAEQNPAEEIGEVVVTKDKVGNIVSVTRQDAEGRVLSIIAESEGISQSSVLAEGYFHPLPDENDYEFHDAEQFPDGSDCPACVPAIIVRRSELEDATSAPQYEEAVKRIEEAKEKLEKME